ncbi:hypothetical protein HDU97_004777 [Phlyctochytrium planicorne]|nr:hypothetical protein HDU97_004777 [Phlyctochytrium planicorne]
MVAVFKSILVAASAFSAVSAIALPANVPSTYESLDLVARSFDGSINSAEEVTMLMHCNLSKDGQVQSQFSEIGLYETLDASRDASTPVHYVGPNVIPGLVDFQISASNYKFNDGRDFISYVSAGAENVPAFQSIGQARIGYRKDQGTYIQYIYNCFRDTGRSVFGASVGDQYADCYAFAYCIYAHQAVA